MEKPKVTLSGIDGNVFVIIGACVKAYRKAGKTPEEVNELKEKMFGANSYDHVLQLAMEYLDVE